MRCIEFKAISSDENKIYKLRDYIISTYDNSNWIIDHQMTGNRTWRFYAMDTEPIRGFFQGASEFHLVKIEVLSERGASQEEIRKAIAFKVGEDGEEKGEEFDEMMLRYGIGYGP